MKVHVTCKYKYLCLGIASNLAYFIILRLDFLNEYVVTKATYLYCRSMLCKNFLFYSKKETYSVHFRVLEVLRLSSIRTLRMSIYPLKLLSKYIKVSGVGSLQEIVDWKPDCSIWKRNIFRKLPSKLHDTLHHIVWPFLEESNPTQYQMWFFLNINF